MATALTDLVDRLPAREPSLSEHLSRQLRLERTNPRVLALAHVLIWSLDSDGYLREDLSELAAVASTEADELEQALAVVQSLEPTGIGARSLRECLLLQLRAQAHGDPIALELVDSHLDALSERRYGELARTLGQPVERIQRALVAIRRLDPRPGRAFGDAPVPTVRVDVTIEKRGDEYHVILRDDNATSGRLSQRDGSATTRDNGHSEDVLPARCVLTAPERRRLTIRAVAESVIRRQPEFFERGPVGLRPMAFRHVADDVGMHESSVSRAVAHRYVDTSHGVFPLRFFFNKGLPGHRAGAVSALTARHRLRDIVHAEDATCPLDDARIAAMLVASGIPIARRTVVKYREILGIPRARCRRVVVSRNSQAVL